MEVYWLLVLHLVGDYVLQSEWMAMGKTTRTAPALAHAVLYTAPFWFLMPSWSALLLVGGTHFVIDRWRLARYVCWSKNFLAPAESLAAPVTRDQMIQGAVYRPSREDPNKFCQVVAWHQPWSKCKDTGYYGGRPAWLAVWLMIIADNTLHMAFNGLAWHLFSTGRL